MTNENLMTEEEMGERLKIKPSTIRQWAREGKIPRRRLSHKVVRYSLADVLMALESPELERLDEGRIVEFFKMYVASLRTGQAERAHWVSYELQKRGFVVAYRPAEQEGEAR